MSEPFELTGAGYLKARQWLKENNLLEVLEKEPSLDGYTTVALANKLYADKLKGTLMTKYRTYTNKELITLIDHKRHQSPIIDELCMRLEKNNFNDDLYVPSQVVQRTQETLTCPICEAKITLENKPDETKDN